MSKFYDILNNGDASDALLGEQIDSSNALLFDLKNKLEVHTVANPFTLQSGITATIRSGTYIKYNEFIWTCVIYLSSMKGFAANTRTKIGTLNATPPLQDQNAAVSNVTIWVDSMASVLTHDGIVELEPDGSVYFTSPIALNDYCRFNGVKFTISNL